MINEETITEKEIDFDQIKFRSSGVGNIMGEKGIGKVAKDTIIGVYINAKYGRRKLIATKFMQKGLMIEEDSITLLSRFHHKFYKKNEEHLDNNFIKGTPDLYEGEEIRKARRIIDIKSSWDIWTFFKAKMEPVNPLYYWQMQAYMDLTGAEVACLVYCLVSTPGILIESEKRKFSWDAGIRDRVDDVTLEALGQIERNCMYDDIPMEKRIFFKDVERCQEDIDRMHERVVECRQWMKENFKQ